MGGWRSRFIALEPGCSKFRGELTSWSSSVEPVGLQPFPTWGGAFLFIVQGGAPIYIYLALCLGTIGVRFILVNCRGPLGRSGVDRLDPGDLLGQGMILAIFLGGAPPGAVSSWLSRGGATIQTVVRGSPPVLSTEARVPYPRGYLT